MTGYHIKHCRRGGWVGWYITRRKLYMTAFQFVGKGIKGDSNQFLLQLLYWGSGEGGALDKFKLFMVEEGLKQSSNPLSVHILVSSIKVVSLTLPAYLEAHRDRWSCPFLLIIGVQQLNLGTQLALLHPTHTLDPANKPQGQSTFSKGYKGFPNLGNQQIPKYIPIFRS